MENGKEVDFLSVAIDFQGPEVIIPYVEKANPSFVTVVDRENLLGRACGVKAIPNGYFIESDLTVSYSNESKFDIRVPEILKKTRKWISMTSDSVGRLESSLGGKLDSRAEDYFTSGLHLYLKGKQAEAILEWTKSVNIDPDNYIIRKQIWAIMHPDKFYEGKVDFQWQLQQMTLDTLDK